MIYMSETKNEKIISKRMEAVSNVVTAFCDRHIKGRCDRIIAGVSGGADSMAMLILLKNYCEKNGLGLVCAHFNHKLRGREADDDERFVKEYCAEKGIESRASSADVRSYAKEKGISEEMAGRELRYAFFFDIACEDTGKKSFIAVAHTKNDKAESVFLNIARGSGTEGLIGIKSHAGDIVRPIISLTREDTEFVCGFYGIDYRTDKTNAENEYKRNAVRNVIFPKTEEYFPSFKERLISLSEIAEDENDYILCETGKAFEECVRVNEDLSKIVVNREKFSKYHVAIMNRIVRLCAEKIEDGGRKVFPQCNGFDRQNTRKLSGFIVSGTAGKTIKLPRNVLCRNNYKDTVIYVQKALNGSVTPEKASGSTEIGDISFEIAKLRDNEEYEFVIFGKHFTVKAMNAEEYFENGKSNVTFRSKNNSKAVFDADKLGDVKVDLRTMGEGDVFTPFKAPGSKPLRRFFTDIKMPAEERKKTVIAAAGKNVLWVAGVRRSDAAIVEKNTKRVIIINCLDF